MHYHASHLIKIDLVLNPESEVVKLLNYCQFKSLRNNYFFPESIFPNYFFPKEMRLINITTLHKCHLASLTGDIRFQTLGCQPTSRFSPHANFKLTKLIVYAPNCRPSRPGIPTIKDMLIFLNKSLDIQRGKFYATNV